MKLVARLLESSAASLTRLACYIALVGLFVLCLSVLWPRPLPVIFAMSGGHAIGVAAFGCYLLAVVLDARRANDSVSLAAPATEARHSTGKDETSGS